MNRTEFISALRLALQGEISDKAVEEHINYYNHYISEEMAKGKQEAEVMELLGDPRLIARTIVDTEGGREQAKDSWTYTDSADSQQKGFHARENKEGGVDLHYGKLNLNSWYGKLLVVVVIVLVLGLIFAIVGGILSAVLPVLVPVLIVLLVIRLFTGRR